MKWPITEEFYHETWLPMLLLAMAGATAAEPPFGPYNQKYTINQNQQFGSTNWYSSALGMGVAQAGVTLIGGLVNAWSRPDPVIYLPSPQPPVYTYPPGAGPRQPDPAVNLATPGHCSMQTLYDRQGAPRYVKVCD